MNDYMMVDPDNGEHYHEVQSILDYMAHPGATLNAHQSHMLTMELLRLRVVVKALQRQHRVNSETIGTLKARVAIQDVRQEADEKPTPHRRTVERNEPRHGRHRA